LLIVISLAAMIYVLIGDRRGETLIIRVVLGLTWLVTMAAFIKTNLDLPYGCTMDFRYIVPTLLCGAGFIALAYDLLREKARTLRTVIVVSTVGFALSSLAFYLFTNG